MTTIQANSTTDNMIRAAVTLTAAAGGDGGNVKLRGSAYSGGVLRVPGYYNGVVIDLAGLTANGAVPLCADHSSSIAARLGTCEAKNDGKSLSIEASIVPGSPDADRAISLARNGGVSLSVGVDPSEIETVQAGKSATVNGQTFSGPLQIARKSELVEVSTVGIGADRSAKAIAASADPVLAERARIREIRGAFAGVTGGEAEADRMIEAGSTVEEANAKALTMLRAQRPTSPAVYTDSTGGAGSTREIVAAAHMLMAGSREAAERAFKGRERILEAAEAMRQRAGGLLGLMRETLAAQHIQVPRDTNELIRAAFSTNEYAGSTATAMRLVAMDALQTAPEPILMLAARKPVQDFRQATLTKFAPVMRLHKLPPGGEIKHIEVGAEQSTVQADTYAAQFGVSRHDYINDELSHYSEIPAHFGREAARTIGDVAEALIVANIATGSNFFSTSNDNYLTGAGTPLGIDSLADAVVAMRTQTDTSGRTLNIAPAFLEVPAELEFAARALVNSSEVRNAAGTAAEVTGNPVQGIAKVVVNARMTAPQWRLWSAPSNAAIVLALLDGVLSPTVEITDPGIDRLGIGYRAWIDFGVGLHEHRAAVVVKGSA